MSFQGVKCAEIARLVHENPDQFYPLFMGCCYVGSPQPKEVTCRAILIKLGFTMMEISRLHSCNFNMVEFKRLSEGSTEKKVDDVSDDAIDGKRSRSSSSSRIDIPTPERELRISPQMEFPKQAYSPTDIPFFDGFLASSSSSRQMRSSLLMGRERLTHSSSDLPSLQLHQEPKETKSQSLSVSISDLRYQAHFPNPEFDNALEKGTFEDDDLPSATVTTFDESKDPTLDAQAHEQGNDSSLHDDDLQFPFD